MTEEGVEELKAEMKLQTELLKKINDNLLGMREEMKASKENGVAAAMAQVAASIKGTPMEGIFGSMMSKMRAGGHNG